MREGNAVRIRPYALWRVSGIGGSYGVVMAHGLFCLRDFLEILALASAPSVTLPPPTKISSRLNHWRLIRQPAQTTGKRAVIINSKGNNSKTVDNNQLVLN